MCHSPKWWWKVWQCLSRQSVPDSSGPQFFVSSPQENWQQTVITSAYTMLAYNAMYCTKQYALLQGIDSDEPILQLGRTVFSGEYRDTLGTKVLFECNSGVYFTVCGALAVVNSQLKYFLSIVWVIHSVCSLCNISSISWVEHLLFLSQMD